MDDFYQSHWSLLRANARAITVKGLCRGASRRSQNVRRKLTPALTSFFKIRGESWGTQLRSESLDDRADAISLFLSLSSLLYPSSLRYCAEKCALRSDTRRELDAGGLDTICRTMSTVMQSSDLFQIHTAIDRWPQLFRAIYTRRNMRFKRSTATGRYAVVPFHSSASPVYYSPVTTSQARDIVTHACARGKKPRVFHTKYYDVPPMRQHGDIMHLAREYLQNCQAGAELKRETKRKFERKREERTPANRNLRQSNVNCSTNAIPTP